MTSTRIQSIDCGETAAEWLSGVLGRSCRLVRQNPDYKRNALRCNGMGDQPLPLLSLANKGQYLMLTLDSLRALLHCTPDLEGSTLEDLAARFRANLVIGSAGGCESGVEPYSEEMWTSLMIGDLCFQVWRALPGCCSIWTACNCEVYSVGQGLLWILCGLVHL